MGDGFSRHSSTIVSPLFHLCGLVLEHQSKTTEIKKENKKNCVLSSTDAGDTLMNGGIKARRPSSYISGDPGNLVALTVNHLNITGYIKHYAFSSICLNNRFVMKIFWC